MIVSNHTDSPLSAVIRDPIYGFGQKVIIKPGEAGKVFGPPFVSGGQEFRTCVDGLVVCHQTVSQGGNWFRIPTDKPLILSIEDNKRLLVKHIKK